MNKEVVINYIDTEILGLNPEFFVLWYEVIINEFDKYLGEINIICCSDEYILELNKTSLDHDYYTDIITFDYCFADFIIGDLYISIDRIRDNASKEGVGFNEELLRVLAHGVLHLCGLGDKSIEESITMREKENWALINVPRETFLL